MRRDFFKELYELMKSDPDIFVLTGDLGYIGFDKIRDEFPNRFVNCGAAEQAMMDIAVGLALSGRKPVVYSITPFLLYRPFETIRTYIDHEKIPVVMIGSGRDDDYKHDGFSHFAGDDFQILSGFENIIKVWPLDSDGMKKSLGMALRSGKPYYINLVR